MSNNVNSNINFLDKRLLDKVDRFSKNLVLKKSFWIVLCCFTFFVPIVRSLIRELPADLPVYYKVPEFKLIDENAKGFGSMDLKGKIYIANFIFTSCPTICPALTQKMEIIQKRVRGLGHHVALISFSVDPENDSPRVLFQFARDHHANPYVWHFLTGDRKNIEDILVKGFKVIMGPKESKSGFKVQTENQDVKNVTIMDIAHSGKFALVDSLGQIRGYYSSENSDINKMMIDVGLLANRAQNF